MIEEYKRILRQMLTKKRYEHSLCVADEAVRLAQKYGCDTEKAFLAGLLHDILKDTPGKEQLQIMSELGIIPTEIELNAPKLWHAMAGSEYLRQKFNMPDDIVSAVRYHTTARSNMSLLEKVVYIADYISVERDYDDVDVMRELSMNKGLDEAALYALKFSFKSLSKKEKLIHTDSVEYYNELIIEREEKI